jgi:hypothetical protein
MILVQVSAPFLRHKTQSHSPRLKLRHDHKFKLSKVTWDMGTVPMKDEDTELHHEIGPD